MLGRRAHRGWKLVAALVALFAAPGARAYDVLTRSSVDVSSTSFRVSTEASVDSSRAGDRHERAEAERRPPQPVAQCSTDVQCYGWCETGHCVNPPEGAANLSGCADGQACGPGRLCRHQWCVGPTLPVSLVCADDRSCGPGRSCVNQRCLNLPPGQGWACADDQSCGPGRACVNRQCVDAGPPPPPPSCTTDAECGQGQSCVSGQCSLPPPPPPPPPPSVLLQRGSELFLRGRTVQLRQDLALGEGPVISTLAVMERVSPVALGRVMRAHRAELVELMGDSSDTSWVPRFLRRVEALNAPGGS